MLLGLWRHRQLWSPLSCLIRYDFVNSVADFAANLPEQMLSKAKMYKYFLQYRNESVWDGRIHGFTFFWSSSLSFFTCMRKELNLESSSVAAVTLFSQTSYFLWRINQFLNEQYKHEKLVQTSKIEVWNKFRCCSCCFCRGFLAADLPYTCTPKDSIYTCTRVTKGKVIKVCFFVFVPAGYISYNE